MTDQLLTTLSTIAWIIGTATTFILLAHWSAGGSWGISNAIVRGITGWTGRSAAIAGEWPDDDELGPIRTPQVERLWGSEAEPSPSADLPAEASPAAELVDLGSRHLP